MLQKMQDAMAVGERTAGECRALRSQATMCGRTALSADPNDLREAFGLDEAPPLAPHYNVPPSQAVAVIRCPEGSPRRTIELVRWGLIPSWADSPKIGHKLALARAETIATAPAFRTAVRSRRCLLVVDGFFEWRREGRQPSQPYFIRRPDRSPFALAGVWERWVSKDGEVIESCAIITQPSRAPVDAIHDRMPLVLEREVWDRWLSSASMEVAALGPLLEPRRPELVAYPVSSHVNDPRHDDPQCMNPVEPAQLRLV
jgi:putative SOS response-associated peptidase YedK